MHRLLLPFLFLSFLGFIASAIVHVLSLGGMTLPIGDAVFGLHIGIFVVWLPAVIVAMRLGRGADRTGFGGFGTGFNSWRTILAGCPRWMPIALLVLFAYAMVNFFIGMRGMPQHGEPADGDTTAQAVRMFSGHWLVFYGAAFAILYSAWRRPELLGSPKCAKGHKALPTDNFCPQCGAAVVRAGKPTSL
jgi:hypothetical protein